MEDEFEEVEALNETEDENLLEKDLILLDVEEDEEEVGFFFNLMT